MAKYEPAKYEENDSFWDKRFNEKYCADVFGYVYEILQNNIVKRIDGIAFVTPDNGDKDYFIISDFKGHGYSMAKTIDDALAILNGECEEANG